MSRAYPAINKCAFIYMYDSDSNQVAVGQFEDWSVNNQLNTLEYRECGYNTPLLVPLDFSFTGSLRKGKLNHNLIKQLWGADAAGKIDIGSFGYWNIPKSKLVLIKQFSDGLSEEKTIYEGVIFFSHAENNFRGLIQEGVGWAAETMTCETQPLVPTRSPETE